MCTMMASASGLVSNQLSVPSILNMFVFNQCAVHFWVTVKGRGTATMSMSSRRSGDCHFHLVHLLNLSSDLQFSLEHVNTTLKRVAVPLQEKVSSSVMTQYPVVVMLISVAGIIYGYEVAFM